MAKANENGNGAGSEDATVSVTIAPTPKGRLLKVNFAQITSWKKIPDVRGVFYAAPEEMMIDREEAGMNAADQVALVYRPFRDGENFEIREDIKDFPEGQEWRYEYFLEICLRCLEDPDSPGEPLFPGNADGREALERWMPGLRESIANAVLQQSGMGLHLVKNAKEELGKLSALTMISA